MGDSPIVQIQHTLENIDELGPTAGERDGTLLTAQMLSTALWFEE